MRTTFRSIFVQAFLLAAWLPASGAAWAEGYPSKPISLIVGFAAGGPGDATGRATAEALSKVLGQPVVVENRAGATGVLGLEQLQRGAPDGYTMALFISSTAIAHIAQKRPFELSKQMIPLGSLITTSVILSVNPKMIDVKNMDDLIAYLKKNPDTPYATSGNGSPAHLNTEALAKKRDLKMNHIAYRGVAPALVDVLGGRVGILFATPASVKSHIEAGSLRPIAVLARKRLNFIKDVPTAAEQGYTDMNVEAYSGLVVPVGTPTEIVDRLRKAQVEILRDESYRKKFENAGDLPEFIDGPEWGAMVQKMHDDAAKIVSDLGLKVQ
jgi:tripartite-type tricarboxylate transporter receptor subunit TctC